MEFLEMTRTSGCCAETIYTLLLRNIRMRGQITIVKAWFTACILPTVFPSSTMIAVAGKAENIQQLEGTSINSVPSDSAFRDCTPEELIPYILGKKQIVIGEQ